MKRSQIRCWKSYCTEPLDKIEHYEKALAENFKGWCIHHRLEIQQDKRVSAKVLKDNGLYFHRPASELIFMRFGEHATLHMTGKHHSAETRKKMSESKKGENHPFFGKHHSAETSLKISAANKGKHRSAETCKKIAESKKGENNPLFGKHHSEDARQKMSEAHKGKLWWNDGVSCKHSRECPGEGWKRGRLKYRS